MKLHSVAQLTFYWQWYSPQLAIFQVSYLPIRLMCAPFCDVMLEPEAEFYASGVSNG